MIKLIRYELKKIFKKKSIYVLGIIAIGLTLLYGYLNCCLDLSDNIDYLINRYEDVLDEYDLTNKDDVLNYVEDKTYYDTLILSKDYDYYSDEVGFINTDEFQDVLYNLNYHKYYTKDETEYNYYLDEYNKNIELLKNFDTQKILAIAKNNLKEKLNYVTIEKERLYIEERIKIIDYRLENNIFYSNKAGSINLDNYESIYETYELSFEKNEDKYDEYSGILNKRMYEEIYMKDKYLFDNKLIQNDFYNENLELIEFIQETFKMIPTLVLLCIILISANILGEEFNKGTIKQLLIKPYTRCEILTSKILASIIVSILFILFYLVTVLLIYGIYLKGFDYLSYPVYVYNFNTQSIMEFNIFKYLFITILGILPEIIILILIAILVSIISGSVPLSIIICFLTYLVPNIFINLIGEYRFAAFIPMYAWELNHYMYGAITEIKYLNFNSALILDIITILILYILSLILFKKKEIKNQ